MERALLDRVRNTEICRRMKVYDNGDRVEQHASSEVEQGICIDAEMADGIKFRPKGGHSWIKETKAVQKRVGLTISSKSRGINKGLTKLRTIQDR